MDPKSLPTYVMFEVEIESLVLNLKSGKSFQFPEMLSNGRANYILFEQLIRKLTGLTKTSKSDHTAADGTCYEQKAYSDTTLYPSSDDDFFHTSASSTFGPNNNGPKIKAFLEKGDYASALKICKETGYDHNEFYIYTNTRGFSPSVPLRFFIVPTADVLANLSKEDPREISRKILLAKITSTVAIQ